MASDTSVKTLVSEVIRCSREQKIHKIIHLMNKFINWKQKKYLRTFSRWAWWYVLAHRRLRQEDKKFKASLGYTVRLHPWPQLRRLLTTILDTANTHAIGTKATANSLSFPHSNHLSILLSFLRKWKPLISQRLLLHILQKQYFALRILLPLVSF